MRPIMRQVRRSDGWGPGQLGMAAKAVDKLSRPAGSRDTKDPRQRTTPARGGGGRGRHVSAPGGRAETHRYENRVPMTIHTGLDYLQAQQSYSLMSVLLRSNQEIECDARSGRLFGNRDSGPRIAQRLCNVPARGRRMP